MTNKQTFVVAGINVTLSIQDPVRNPSLSFSLSFPLSLSLYLYLPLSPSLSLSVLGLCCFDCGIDRCFTQLAEEGDVRRKLTTCVVCSCVCVTCSPAAQHTSAQWGTVGGDGPGGRRMGGGG